MCGLDSGCVWWMKCACGGCNVCGVVAMCLLLGLNTPASSFAWPDGLTSSALYRPDRIRYALS